MNLSKQLIYPIACLCLALASGGAIAKNCEIDNAALRDMPMGLVEFTNTEGDRSSVEVKVANKNRTRAAGFQRVCSSTIAKTPILFVFSSPRAPRFHMNNVVAPIDIAFIRADGSIDSVQAMQPYILMSKDKPTYGPGSNVIAALEAHPGFFEQRNIDISATVSWSLTDKKTKPE